MDASPPYVVIGQPIRHSLSPLLFRFLFEQVGLAATYEAREVGPDALPDFVQRLRAGEWLGASVTLPHKEAVLSLVDQVDVIARRIGAVNTLVRAPGGVVGHNTDAHGFVQALRHAGVSLQAARVVVLGAGGAARSAVFSAVEQGAQDIVVANRTLARAEGLVRDARLAGGESVRAVALQAATLEAALASASVLVNSTKAGLGTAEENPLPASLTLHPGLTVLDMVYRPLETVLLRAARESGCRTVDGLWMLVFQAAEQLRLWTGQGVPSGALVALHEHLKGAAT